MKCPPASTAKGSVEFQRRGLVPLRVFVVAQKIVASHRGVRRRQDDGVCPVSPGSRGGHSYLHSQMLAVRTNTERGPGSSNQALSADDALPAI